MCGRFALRGRFVGTVETNCADMRCKASFVVQINDVAGVAQNISVTILSVGRRT